MGARPRLFGADAKASAPFRFPGLAPLPEEVGKGRNGGVIFLPSFPGSEFVQKTEGEASPAILAYNLMVIIPESVMVKFPVCYAPEIHLYRQSRLTPHRHHTSVPVKQLTYRGPLRGRVYGGRVLESFPSRRTGPSSAVSDSASTWRHSIGKKKPTVLNGRLFFFLQGTSGAGNSKGNAPDAKGTDAGGTLPLSLSLSASHVPLPLFPDPLHWPMPRATFPRKEARTLTPSALRPAR